MTFPYTKKKKLKIHKQNIGKKRDDKSFNVPCSSGLNRKLIRQKKQKRKIIK